MTLPKTPASVSSTHTSEFLIQAMIAQDPGGRCWLSHHALLNLPSCCERRVYRNLWLICQVLRETSGPQTRMDIWQDKATPSKVPESVASFLALHACGREVTHSFSGHPLHFLRGLGLQKTEGRAPVGVSYHFDIMSCQSALQLAQGALATPGLSPT